MLKPDTAFPRDAEFLDYIRSFVDESRLSGAAVDRLFALARRGAEASEASNLRGMVRHHQDQTTALRAEIERLKEQLESPFMDGYETAKEEYRPRLIAAEAEVERLTAERDRQYDQNAEQITRIAALEAENEKLRAALEEINVGEGWAALIARAVITQENTNDKG